MHGQGNYPTQVGQGPYAPPPAFQQHPAASAPPPASYHGPRPPVIQQGHPSFHFSPGIHPHQHAIPSVAHQRPPDPAVSTGMGSAQSYLSQPQPPQVHVSSQMSHSYQTSEQQRLLWSQNIHQLPPPPPRGPNAYSTPSSQAHTLERVQHHQVLSHVPPPQPPPYSSRFLNSEPFGTSAPSMGQHPYLQPMGPLPPPPPRPPPPPPPLSSPPRVPPFPPSSPLSDIPQKKDGIRSLKGLLDGENWKSSEERQVHQIEVPRQLTEKSPEIESVDAVAHSPADSDMDMEDDITHPDEEKKNYLSNNSNDEHISISQGDNVKEQKALLHTGGQRLPKVAEDGNSLAAKLSLTKDQRGGSGITTDRDLTITRKVSSEADNLGMRGQTEQPLDCSLNTSSLHKDFSEPSSPVVYAEAGCGKLPCQQLKEASDPFKLLQEYASNINSEDEGEDLLRDLSPPPTTDRSQPSHAKEVGCVGSELRLETLLESDKPIPSKSTIESPKNVTEADESSFATGKLDKFSQRSHRGQESVSVSHSASLQPKRSSSNYDANIGPEGANVYKADMNSNSTKLNVDEFGRLIREGVSDSDMSDSSHHARRHARRSRKRSRSRSPHDRRRRKSPRRRKERHGRSRSFSPKRRRSSSRSPVLKRGSEYSGDKLKWGKAQLPECFDFRRGKCYRGANCRYSHHESDKRERLRYNKGKHENRILPDKEVKDRFPQDVPVSEDVKDAKELPVDSAIHSPDKSKGLGSGSHLVTGVVARNLSAYSANNVPSGEQNTMISESPAQYSDKIPQIVDQQGISRGGSLISESPLLQASAATSAHLTADAKQDLADANCGPTSQLHSVGSPVMKSYSTEEVPSQSFKELPPSIANHPSHLNLVSSSAPQVMSAPFPEPIMRDYSFMPPVAQINPTAKHFTASQAPVAYQHPHFPALLNSLSASFLPPPPPPRPPPPPHSHLAVNVTSGELSLPPQTVQQISAPRWDSSSPYTSTGAQPTELYQTGLYQDYPLAREPDQMQHTTDNSGPSGSHVSNLMNRQVGAHIMGEDRSAGNPRQVMNSIESFAQAQPNSLIVQSPSKGTHCSLGGVLPSDRNSSDGRPYFQQACYGLQYSGGPGQVSSSMSRITPDFLERNHPSYAGDFEGSRAPNHFNPYASTFDHPLSSKFSLNAVIPENDTIVDTKHGVPVGLSSVPINANKIGSVGSENMISSSNAALPTEDVLPRPGGGDQYDPLVDSIEPASTSFSRVARLKYETTGDSDNMLRFSGSGRVLSMEGVNQDGTTAVSTNDLIENEEFGETADAEEVGAVSNLSPSDPNVAIDTNEGEIEIDQVKVSGKQKKGKGSRSMRLFKISIATFVKEVLKPSWRQGNMSKEAFKTIVKKTVDKVSGAMKSRKIPKSQAKINHYIDSSRGKLTKLVMGYVDKYVKA